MTEYAISSFVLAVLSLVALLLLASAAGLVRRDGLVIACIILIVACMAHLWTGCVASPGPVAHPEQPRCAHNGPPSRVVSIEDERRWRLYLQCTGIGKDYGPAWDIYYVERLPGDEDDE